MVLIPPPDTHNNPVIWNENVCKVFVKEKTPSPHLAIKFDTSNRRKKTRGGRPFAVAEEELDLSSRQIDHSCSCEAASSAGGHERELLAGLNDLRAREDLTDVTLWAATMTGHLVPFHAHR